MSCRNQRHRRKTRNFSEWSDRWVRPSLPLDPGQRLFQFVLKAGKISGNFLFQHLFSELNPPFAQLRSWTIVSRTNQQQNQYGILAICELSTLHSRASLEPFIGLPELMPLASLMRSYTPVTNIRIVPTSARLLILCLSNILVIWKVPLLYIGKNSIPHHTVLVPWSKKISC